MLLVLKAVFKSLATPSTRQRKEIFRIFLEKSTVILQFSLTLLTLRPYCLQCFISGLWCSPSACDLFILPHPDPSLLKFLPALLSQLTKIN